jgi:VanZ family protein
MTANRIARVSGWLLVSAAVFLTLAPRTFRPQTGVEHHLEHVLAFALLGLAFGLGYPGRRLLLALVGVAMAALLEVLQSWVPGRHANLSDFMMNAIGVGAGLAAAALVDWMRRKRRDAPTTSLNFPSSKA